MMRLSSAHQVLRSWHCRLHFGLVAVQHHLFLEQFMQPGLPHRSRCLRSALSYLVSWQGVGGVADRLMVIGPREAVGLHGFLVMGIRVTQTMWRHAGHTTGVPRSRSWRGWGGMVVHHRGLVVDHRRSHRLFRGRRTHVAHIGRGWSGGHHAVPVLHVRHAGSTGLHHHHWRRGHQVRGRHVLGLLMQMLLGGGVVAPPDSRVLGLLVVRRILVGMRVRMRVCRPHPFTGLAQDQNFTLSLVPQHLWRQLLLPRLRITLTRAIVLRPVAHPFQGRRAVVVCGILLQGISVTQWPPLVVVVWIQSGSSCKIGKKKSCRCRWLSAVSIYFYICSFNCCLANGQEAPSRSQGQIITR